MSQPQKQPNILLIMSDQHHKGIMGCAGHPLVQTPNLDALAGRATRFQNAICNFPLCGPSRASFMTGRHPHETEVWGNNEEFRSDMPTYAHAFGAAGYETVLSGRMHFVGADQRHGFERRVIGDCPASGYIAAGWQLGDVLGMLRDTPGMSRSGLTKSGAGRSGYLAYDEAVTDAAVQYLRERSAADEARPMMLTVGYAMPHCPFVADPADYALYADSVAEPTATEADLAHQHPLIQDQRAKFGSAPLPEPAVRKRVTAAYYGMVTHLDRQVGRVLQALADAGMAEDTIVVYTSDHGEQLGEHGCWWKSTFYEGSVGVPLLVARPGAAASVSPANVGLMDIGPTLLDLAGLPPLPGATGRSFRASLDGHDADWDDTVFAENVGKQPEFGPWRMIKRGHWKYNYYHGSEPELFDLSTDPTEDHNLAGDPAHAALEAQLRAAVLDGWDPDSIAVRQSLRRREASLLGRWQKEKQPAESDAPWFGDSPPENYLVDSTETAS